MDSRKKTVKKVLLAVDKNNRLEDATLSERLTCLWTRPTQYFHRFNPLVIGLYARALDNRAVAGLHTPPKIWMVLGCSSCCCARPCSGMIEFDEFLDIMWDVKHAKGSSRGLLFSRAGVFLEGTLAAAQAALLSKRQQVRTPLTGASGLGGFFSHGHDAQGDGALFASQGSHGHATNSMASSTASGEQREEQEQPTQQLVVQERQLAMTTTTLSAAMMRGKEAALSILPKLSSKTAKWRGFSRTH